MAKPGSGVQGVAVSILGWQEGSEGERKEGRELAMTP